MASTDDLNRLSGVVLPLILQRKLKSQERASEKGKEDSNNGKDADGSGEDAPDARENQVFTAEELEERIWKARLAMSDIQKQLIRGEESYYEETNGHGNLFRGWDLFIDARDLGTSASSFTGAGGRRMPADFRWFSSSCVSTGRTTRPMPLPSKNLPSLPPVKSAFAVRSAPNTQNLQMSSAGAPQSVAEKTNSGDVNVGEAKKGPLEQDGLGATSAPEGANALDDTTKAEVVQGSQSADVGSATKDEADNNKGQGKVNESRPEIASVSALAAASPPKADNTVRRTRKRKGSEL